MATVSFTTDFKISAKSGHKLATAIEHSEYKEHKINQKKEVLSDQETINFFVNDLLRNRK